MLQEELFDDLKSELSVTSEIFNENLLTTKIKNAIREVKIARKYPNSYSDETIETDLENYYGNIRDIALFDYKQIGAEFQKSDSENTYTRTWVDRNTLFAGINAISRVNK